LVAGGTKRGLRNTHKQFIHCLKAKGIRFKIKKKFNIVLGGLLLETSSPKELIKSCPQVENVYENTRVKGVPIHKKPHIMRRDEDLEYAKEKTRLSLDIIGVSQMYESGYTGKGIKGILSQK
jgi:hypothetical protein